jgi:hypothetical protein
MDEKIVKKWFPVYNIEIAATVSPELNNVPVDDQLYRFSMFSYDRITPPSNLERPPRSDAFLIESSKVNTTEEKQVMKIVRNAKGVRFLIVATHHVLRDYLSKAFIKRRSVEYKKYRYYIQKQGNDIGNVTAQSRHQK